MLRDRFYSHVKKSDDCWLWIGAKDSQGYGFIRINRKTKRATHIALLLNDQPRPTSVHEACHSCDNPSCVRPDHLWWGLPIENTYDAELKGIRKAARERGAATKKSAPTCRRGHLRTPENIRIDGGHARCVICRRLETNSRRARRKAAA